MPNRKIGRGVTLVLVILVMAIILLSATNSNLRYSQDKGYLLSSQTGVAPHQEQQGVSDQYNEVPTVSDYDNESSLFNEGHSVGLDSDSSLHLNNHENNSEHDIQQDDSQHIEPIVITEYIQYRINSIADSHGAVGAQVVIIQNGKIIGTHEFGFATLNSRAMEADTKIRVASLTKPILAMLAIRLQEEGMINIDTDIGEYWGMPVRNPYHPDIAITIRHLITHTSSIYAFELPFQTSASAHRSQLRAGNFFTDLQPGEIESWYYNNFAYCFFGVTLELATNETVNNLANRFFFEPLGIDAAFGSGSISDTGNLATLYRESGNVARSVQQLRSILGSTHPGQSGAQFTGGLTISAGDYAKLIAALIGYGEFNSTRILSAESVALVNSSHGTVLEDESRDIITPFNHCLAFRWWTDVLGQEELFWHTGEAFGVAALASFNPINGNGVIVVTTGADLERLDNYMHVITAEISEFVYSLF